MLSWGKTGTFLKVSWSVYCVLTHTALYMGINSAHLRNNFVRKDRYVPLSQATLLMPPLPNNFYVLKPLKALLIHHHAPVSSPVPALHSVAVRPGKPFVLHVSQKPDSLSCGIQQDCFSSNKAECCFLGEKNNEMLLKMYLINRKLICVN